MLIQKHEHISFGNRLSFYESMQMLNSFICSIHITKPRYALQGFASPRYIENIIMNTPALVPEEFLYPGILGDYWTVSSPEDVYKKVIELKNMDVNNRETIVAEQRDSFLRHHNFDVGSVCEFIESKI